MKDADSDINVQKLTPQLITELAETLFCEPRIAEWAEKFEKMPMATANLWVEELTEAGEDLALSRLLNIFAYCGFVLEPGVLVRSGMVVSDITCLSYIFSLQNENAIPHLLKMARSEELSLERQVLFVRLAAELTLRYDVNDDEVRRLLQYMSDVSDYYKTLLLVHETLTMLDSGGRDMDEFSILTDRKIKDYLPERPPPKVIGSGGTLRRPVARLGRNDLCHCGSGKKYKRCCLKKDEKLLADASEYEGITQTQLQENPGIVDDTRLISAMRAYQIKKLDPSTLGGSQLIAAYKRAIIFGLFDIAYKMLMECSARTDLDFEFDFSHFACLMDQALSVGRMDVAERARQHIPDDCSYLVDWDDVNMQFELHSAPEAMLALEQRCKAALNPDEDDYDEFICDNDLFKIVQILRYQFPAISILFARAAVAQCPEMVFDNEVLVEIVHENRVDLGLDPWDDPIDEMAAAGENEYRNTQHAMKHVYIENDLRGELSVVREQAKALAKKLRDAEADLQRIKKEMAAVKRDKVEADNTPDCQLDAPSPEQRETMERLRRQIDNFKVEIGNQQEQRRKLREQLEREQRSEQGKKSSVNRNQQMYGSDEQVEIPSKSERRVVIPAYKDSFKNACKNVPVAVGGAALKAIAGIVSYDAAAWKNFRSIKKLSNIYRMRIGIHYRLMLLWLPGEKLCALDLIPRQDLESWIKRHEQ